MPDLGQYGGSAQPTEMRVKPRSYFADDDRIMDLAPRAVKGDHAALDELRVIYRRGQFDPGFGRELQALLGDV